MVAAVSSGPSVGFLLQIYRGRIHLAHQIKRVNDAIQNVRIVHYTTKEQKSKLLAQAKSWEPEYKKLKDTVKNDRIARILSGGEMCHWIVLCLQYPNANQRFLVAEDLTGQIQGCGVFSSQFDRLEYLVTAPSNLVENPPLRGLGTGLVREGMRRCLIYGHHGLSASTMSSSAGFYEKLGFVFVDKEISASAIRISSVQMKKHATGSKGKI